MLVRFSTWTRLSHRGNCMIHHLFRVLSRLVPHTHKAAKHAANLTPRLWFHGGKAVQHTSTFITKQSLKGLKFPK